MPLEVVSDMVGVAPREGGADGADHLLGGLGVKTRYVLLGRVNLSKALRPARGLEILISCIFYVLRLC